MTYSVENFMEGFKLPTYGSTPAKLGSGLYKTPAAFYADTSGSAPEGGGFMDFFKGMAGTKDAPGPGSMMLGTANTAWNIFAGLRQYGQAKDALNFQKESFNKNFGMQKMLTDRQIASQEARRAIEGRVPAQPYNSGAPQQQQAQQLPPPENPMLGFRNMGAA